MVSAGCQTWRTAASEIGDDLDRAAEADIVAHLRPVEFPWVAERQPILGVFLLPAILHDLAEQAVVVADAVAVAGMSSVAMLSMKQAASRPRPPLPSAASGSSARSLSRSTSRPAKRGAHGLEYAQVVEVVEQQPADEKFQRQVIDALRPLLVGVADAGEPAIDDAVPQSEGGGHEPVALGGDGASLADGIRQFFQDGGLQRREIFIVVSSIGGRIVLAGGDRRQIQLKYHAIHLFVIRFGPTKARLVRRLQLLYEFRQKNATPKRRIEDLAGMCRELRMSLEQIVTGAGRPEGACAMVCMPLAVPTWADVVCLSVMELVRLVGRRAGVAPGPVRPGRPSPGPTRLQARPA